jgi:rare lipoprotein A (peptidoglycan hydrolase)
MHQISAAHRDLPFGTIVTFYNPAGQNTVTVTITDRGPYDPNKIPADPNQRKLRKYLTPHPNRTFDLSWKAAHILGITQKGIADVYVKIGHP